MYKNVIVVPHINVIGGVETFAYELVKKYGKDYDITVMYMDGFKHRHNIQRACN